MTQWYRALVAGIQLWRATRLRRERLAFYRECFETSAYTINDIRRLEGLPPIEDDVCSWFMLPEPAQGQKESA